jgi:hypothetical protein
VTPSLEKTFRRIAEGRRARRLVSPAMLPTTEYLQQFPGRWHVVHEAEPLHWSHKRRFGSRRIDFDLPATAAEFGVLELENGRVFGTHGWIIGTNGAVLPDLSWYGGPNERIRIPRRLRTSRRLRGTCLSLVSDWSCRNYAHFLLDALGRLALFAGGGFELSQVDHVYCPTPPSPAAAQLLDRFEIPPEKRVWAAADAVVHADLLFVPSLPATALTYQAWLPRFLRGVVPSAGTRPQSRRLYVTRRGFSRQVATEQTLLPLLADRGFEIYDPTEHVDQPDDFLDAAVVVGAHGAALANLAFCRTGTAVLELLPTDNAYPFYYSLAVAGGLSYGYLAGESAGERAAGAFGPSPYDFVVAPDEFAAALDQVTGPEGRATEA